MQQKEEDKSIVMTENEITWLVAAVLLMIVFSFVGGVYYGKWQAAADVVNHIERESFADRVYYALSGSHVVTGGEDEGGFNEGYNNPDDNTMHNDSATPEEIEDSGDSVEEDLAPVSRYKAQLAGFGTKNAAHAYCTKLKKRGIAADIDERVSRTKKGKRITWFQVVVVDEKEVLDRIVERLKKDDKLTNVPIIHI